MSDNQTRRNRTATHQHGFARRCSKIRLALPRGLYRRSAVMGLETQPAWAQTGQKKTRTIG